MKNILGVKVDKFNNSETLFIYFLSTNDCPFLLLFGFNLFDKFFEDTCRQGMILSLLKGKRRRSHGRDLVSRRLKPTHVKEILIGTLNELKLGLRFFNFLGLHRGFDHSTASFCVLIHTMVKSNLFWPASSLLQTLLLRRLNPSEDFHALYTCYEKSAQDVAECLDKSQKNLLTIWTIKAVVANDLFTDDSFMVSHSFFYVIKIVLQFCKENSLNQTFQTLQSECQVSLNTVDSVETFVSDINNGRWDSVLPQVSQLKLPRNKLEDLYEQPTDSSHGDSATSSNQVPLLQISIDTYKHMYAKYGSLNELDMSIRGIVVLELKI
ncbi:unnamed protein product [Brassica oleracea]